MARSWRPGTWRKRRMVVASGMLVVPGSMPAKARYTGMSCDASRPASSASANHCCRKWTRSSSWAGYGGPCRGEGSDPGDDGVPRDDGEHLLEEGLQARALGGPFETVREAQLVHVTMIPATALAPLPFPVNL